MPAVVLDASALMALLQDEPGADRVEAVLDEALISAVNYCEVVGKLQDYGVPSGDIAAILAAVPLDVIAFDAAQAIEAGALRPATRRSGLSLGDRACLALARIRGASALTADKAWLDLDIGVDVVALR